MEHPAKTPSRKRTTTWTSSTVSMSSWTPSPAPRPMRCVRASAASARTDNSILIFSELMDSESLFLTANADTVYFLGIVDLSNGPMVMETPPQALGIFDDMWWQWVIDFGLPGPEFEERAASSCWSDRDMTGPYRTAGSMSRTPAHRGSSCWGVSFIENDDPKPTVERIKRTLKLISGMSQAAHGTSIATLLEGKVRPGTPSSPPETTFIEVSGKAFNTIPPTDFGFFELLNALVQDEPADATDSEILGQLEAIGIVKDGPV